MSDNRSNYNNASDDEPIPQLVRIPMSYDSNDLEFLGEDDAPPPPLVLTRGGEPQISTPQKKPATRQKSSTTVQETSHNDQVEKHIQFVNEREKELKILLSGLENNSQDKDNKVKVFYQTVKYDITDKLDKNSNDPNILKECEKMINAAIQVDKVMQSQKFNTALMTGKKRSRAYKEVLNIAYNFSNPKRGKDLMGTIESYTSSSPTVEQLKTIWKNEHGNTQYTEKDLFAIIEQLETKAQKEQLAIIENNHTKVVDNEIKEVTKSEAKTIITPSEYKARINTLHNLVESTLKDKYTDIPLSSLSQLKDNISEELAKHVLTQEDMTQHVANFFEQNNAKIEQIVSNIIGEIKYQEQEQKRLADEAQKQVQDCNALAENIQKYYPDSISVQDPHQKKLGEIITSIINDPMNSHKKFTEIYSACKDQQTLQKTHDSIREALVLLNDENVTPYQEKILQRVANLNMFNADLQKELNDRNISSLAEMENLQNIKDQYNIKDLKDIANLNTIENLNKKSIIKPAVEHAVRDIESIQAFILSYKAEDTLNKKVYANLNNQAQEMIRSVEDILYDSQQYRAEQRRQAEYARYRNDAIEYHKAQSSQNIDNNKNVDTQQTVSSQKQNDQNNNISKPPLQRQNSKNIDDNSIGSSSRGV